MAEKFKPHHLGISVPDLEASINWYKEMLGFSLEKSMEIKELNAKIAFLYNGNFRIELFEVAGAESLQEARRHPDLDLKTHGIKHLAYEVENVSAFIGELKKRGVDIAMDVNKMENKEMAFIRDNSGNLIEIVEAW